ncbi:hypothetical protein ACS79_21540 [Vibrio lentus]|nr:hypothetical protein ACS79_21540 [Vibrio lentus]
MCMKNRESRISVRAFVSNNNNISKGVRIADGCRVFDSKVGVNSYLADHACLTKTNLGAYSSIGPSVKVNLGNHPVELVSTSPSTFSNTTSNRYSQFEEVFIGNDVWIGANVLVKGGVTISDGAVIGAGSYVNKDVPPYAIVVGSPAKVIKYRFSEDKIKAFLKIKWWEWDVKKIEKIKSNGGFDNVEQFIEEHTKENG